MLNILKSAWKTSREFTASLLVSQRRSNVSDEDAQSGAALSPQSILRKREDLSEQLPRALVAAFNTEPLEPNDPRFVGREEELAALLDALEDWRNGRASLTAITAPHGAGITSLLNQVRSKVQPAEILSCLSLAMRPCSAAEALRLMNSIFEFEPAPETVSEMVLAIKNSPPRVIIIDDGHMLLSRKMGNMAAVQTIGAILVATQHCHCWIVGCAKQAWRRLSFLYQSDRFFNRIIELDYFSAGEMSDIIERRFYGLGYEWSERLALEEDKADPMPAKFKQLHDISNGLPEMAFFFLLFAMEKEPDVEAFGLSQFSHLDTGIIKTCSEEELFSLAEIFVHGVMEHADHETLFRISPEQSLLRLERLCRAGILHRIATGEHYTSNSYYLSPILAQAMVSHLVLSNRLY
ncbi:hypothetical protein R50072_00790 [Simiduia litorea]|uniref:hypothetical protein n=1 Tax=Simiduia litorea TaxID=1435348 RepID=UPI0036F317CF